MRRALFLLVLCGCASAGSTSEDQQQHAKTSSALLGRQRLGRSSPNVRVRASPRSQRRRRAVWLAVKKVYADSTFRSRSRIRSTHQIGNQNFFKTRQIARRVDDRLRRLWLRHDRAESRDVSDLHIAR